MTGTLSPSERRIWRAALSLADLLRFRVSAELKPVSDLTQAEHSVLMHIAEAPGQQLRQQSLANTLCWSKSRLSHQLTRMQARGLVERIVESATEVQITLTAAGLVELKESDEAHAAAVRRHLLHLATEEELAALVRLADRLKTVDVQSLP